MKNLIKLLLILQFCVLTKSLQSQITITTNTVWDLMNPPPIQYKKGIIIQGSTLEINGFSGINKLVFDDSILITIDSGKLVINNSEFIMGKSAKIQLESSCYEEFISTNSIFRTSNNHTWKGIEIGMYNCGGQGLSSQFLVNPTTNNEGNCTKAEWAGVLSPIPSKILVNNCKFFNAEKALFSDGQYNYYTGGGIIRARESEFNNCLNSIVVKGWSRGEINASYVMTCDFNWTDSIPMEFDKKNLKFILLDGLDNTPIRIGGCQFRNNISSLDSFIYRGIGIHAISSSFSITKDGDKCCNADTTKCPDNCFEDINKLTRNNLFTQLGYGILFEGDENEGFKLDCRNSDFHTCYRGIEMNYCLDGLIGLNTFTIYKAMADDFFFPGTTNNSGFIHISHKNSSGIRIYENVFVSNMDFIVGVKSDSPNMLRTSFIRRNTFNNVQTTITALCGPEIRAIDLYGNNDYLDIDCNAFKNQVYDVRINNLASLNDIPDMYVKDFNNRFNRNSWSIIPQNQSLPNYKWLSDGCASNIYSEFGDIIIYDRFSTLGHDNLRFDQGSFQVIQPQNRPSELVVSTSTYNCKSLTNGLSDTTNNCVDCRTHCSKLDVKEIDQLSINKMNISKNGFFEVYPNPVDENFTIKIKKRTSNVNNVIIYDFGMRKIYKGEINNQYSHFHKSDFAITPGIYYIHICNTHQSDTIKLIFE